MKTADIQRYDGPDADPDAPCSLVVEVPHGADRFAHYTAVRQLLKGALPNQLEHFFFANTDVGAWQYGSHVAERVVAARADRSALVIRCLIPRTFVDTNRIAEARDELSSGGLTAAVAPYIRDPNDVSLLLDLHRRYSELAASHLLLALRAGGFALLPHTYGPRSMAIERVDEHIVTALHDAAEPTAWENAPLRPEVDVLTRDKEGTQHAPKGMAEALIAAYAELGITAEDSATYRLHPATQGWRWAKEFAQQVLCMEVRRDLLVRDFSLFKQLAVDAEAVAKIAGPVVNVIDAWLADRDR